ncbi:MAG: hypothetical protein GXO87_08310 [Chlorobi bacterium]|nr:hypothetical protein [Chlorobiota bacterium]
MGTNNLSAKITLAALFVYVVLFEFILPPIKIVPVPSELPNVLTSLFADYHLLFAFGSSLLAVLSAILFSAFLLFLFSKNIAQIIDKYKTSIKALNGIRYLTLVSVAALFALWFGDSLYAELIAVFLFFFSDMFFTALDKSAGINSAYIDAALGLKISEDKIYKEVYFKSLLPFIRDKLTSLHLSLWAFLLIYEIFAGENLGAIFKMIAIYSDYSALFLFVIILALMIFILNYLLQTLIDKTIFWNNR